MSLEKGRKVFGYCGCFFSRNIFLQDYRLHVHFSNEEQFRNEFSEVLRSRGCDSPEAFAEVLRDVHDEIQRRMSYDARSLERSLLIKNSYRPKHLEVYNLQESFLSPEFLSICEQAKVSGELSPHVEAISGTSQVFRLPVFTAAFCRLLLAELDHFKASGMPRERPNTMTKHGVLLGEVLDFDAGLLTPLRERYLLPLCARLFPECQEAELDSHRGFTVDYTDEDGTGDRDLATHYDNAEITLNVCLSEDYEGGELTVGGLRHEPPRALIPVEHRFCFGLLHRGALMHGAVPVNWGRRVNLVLWMRSSGLRREQGCPRCSRQFEACDLREAFKFGDGFLLSREEYCPAS